MTDRCKECYHYRAHLMRKCNALNDPDAEGEDCFAFKTAEQVYQSRKKALKRLIDEDLLWLRDYYDNSIEPEEWEQKYVQEVQKHKGRG